MALISLMGFPPISSTLQTFQICIFNTKNSKLTFSNGSQLMGKRFIANLHASLDSICKGRIFKISTRCQNWGVHSTIFYPELRNEFKIFPILEGSIPQLLILNWEMDLKIFLILERVHSHNFWTWTQKWIQKFSNHGGVHSTIFDPELRNEFKNFPIMGESIPQFLILNSEMNSKILQSFGGPFHNFWSELRNELNFFPSSGGPFHSIWSWTQKWIQKFFQPWGVHSTTLNLNSEMNSKILQYFGGPLHNLWSWTQKWT